MINFDLSLLKNYSEFAKINKNWNVLSYVNYMYDIDAALAFYRFFFPIYIEKKTCVLNEMLFNEEAFQKWTEIPGISKTEIERISNQYEVADLFHISSSKYQKIEPSSEKLVILGEMLKVTWKHAFEEQFPGRKVKIELHRSDDLLFITTYEDVISDSYP